MISEYFVMSACFNFLQLFLGAENRYLTAFSLLQDLQEGLQVVRVGGINIRWVLIQHADPWLLNVSCKQLPQSHLKSQRRPLLRSQHNIPSIHKRCSRELQQEAEEPPAKKPAVDTEKVTAAETLAGSSANVTEKPDEEEQQKETADGGDMTQNLEEVGDGKTCPEEEEIETEQRHETRRRSRRSSLGSESIKEADSGATGTADEE